MHFYGDLYNGMKVLEVGRFFVRMTIYIPIFKLLVGSAYLVYTNGKHSVKRNVDALLHIWGNILLYHVPICFRDHK